MAVVETMGTIVTIDGDPIYGVGDISGPSPEREVIDITNHSSPAGARERRATILDYGEVSFPITAVDPTDVGVGTAWAALLDNTQVEVIITYPDGTTVTFDGKVRQFELEAPVEGVLNGNMTLMPESAPTIDWFGT